MGSTLCSTICLEHQSALSGAGAHDAGIQRGLVIPAPEPAIPDRQVGPVPPRLVEPADRRCRGDAVLQFSEPKLMPAAPEQLDSMIYIACEIGGAPAEMLVDTGAQVSVISLPMVRQLNLQGYLDSSQQGVAAGVGQAPIVGLLRNVPVSLGEVRFTVDFSVLSLGEEMLMLGLDQLTRFGCVLDLENRFLLFKRHGGAVVPFLPPNPRRMRNQLGCSLM